MDLSELEAEIELGGGAEALDAMLIDGHRDRDPHAMCALHQLAARYWKEDAGQAAFHQTHAYVYALEAGMWDEVDTLYALLAAHGRI